MYLLLNNAIAVSNRNLKLSYWSYIIGTHKHMNIYVCSSFRRDDDGEPEQPHLRGQLQADVQRGQPLCRGEQRPIAAGV